MFLKTLLYVFVGCYDNVKVPINSTYGLFFWQEEGIYQTQHPKQQHALQHYPFHYKLFLYLLLQPYTI